MKNIKELQEVSLKKWLLENGQRRLGDGSLEMKMFVI